ncbi:MAG: prepilin-type N-terminal cleavage/methylation domain-containing protein [Eubacteriaceae bacterium]|nr:prepilin-type N-terminal cleavage/methylation domain-containing protein [Eubacteriaceae bacterium]
MAAQWKRMKKDESGFTLVEMIVTLVIMGIVLTVAGTTYFFGTRMYTQTETKNTAKSVGDSVYKYMTQELTYGYAIDIRTDRKTTSAPEKFLSDSDGTQMAGDGEKDGYYLYFGNNQAGTNQNILGQTFYNKYTVQYKVELPEAASVAQTNLFKLTVIVLDSDKGQAYTTEGTVKALNCAAIAVDGSTTGGRQSTVVNPVINYQSESGDATADSAMISAKALRAKYVEMYEFIYNNPNINKIEAKYPGYTAQNGSSATAVNNDCISKYLFNVTYQKKWPDYPAQTSQNSSFDYVNDYFKDYPSTASPQLYMRPYCYIANDKTEKTAEAECIVFVSSSNVFTADWTNSYFIYDCSSGMIAVSTPHTYTKKLTGKGGFVGQSWTTFKATIPNDNWQEFVK